MHNKQKGTWVTVNQTGMPYSHKWPESTAISTGSLHVSAEQLGHYTFVRGTDKIVLSNPARVSHQIAPVRSEHDQESTR